MSEPYDLSGPWTYELTKRDKKHCGISIMEGEALIVELPGWYKNGWPIENVDPFIIAKARAIIGACNAHDDLLAICRDILSPDDDYGGSDDPAARCVECGTKRARHDQQFCDVPGCFALRVRAALAKADTLNP